MTFKFSRRNLLKVAAGIGLPATSTIFSASAAYAYNKGVKPLTPNTSAKILGTAFLVKHMYDGLNINGQVNKNQPATSLAEIEAKYKFQYLGLGITGANYFLDPTVQSDIFRVNKFNKFSYSNGENTVFTVNIVCLRNGTGTSIPLNINSSVNPRARFANYITCANIGPTPATTAATGEITRVSAVNDHPETYNYIDNDYAPIVLSAEPPNSNTFDIYTAEAHLTADNYVEIVHDNTVAIDFFGSNIASGSGVEIEVSIKNLHGQPAQAGEPILIDFNPGKGWFAMSQNMATVDESGNIRFKIFSLYSKNQHGGEIILRNLDKKVLARINGIKTYYKK